MKSTDTNVTTTVSQALRAELEIKAAMLGVSLSKYVAGLCAEAVVDAPTAGSPIYVRAARDRHGSLGVTIPPEIAGHLGISPGQPLGFVPIPGGAIIRTIR